MSPNDVACTCGDDPRCACSECPDDRQTPGGNRGTGAASVASAPVASADRELTPFEIAQYGVQTVLLQDPENEWAKVDIARCHLEALLSELDYYRVRMMVAVSFLDSEMLDTFHEHVAEIDAKHRES